MKMRLAKIIWKYKGAPYCLGGQSRETGFDCLSLVRAIGRDLKADIKDEWQGITVENYVEIWKHDKNKAKNLFEQYLLTLGREIDPAFAFAGDILIFSPRKKDDAFMGIHAGQDMVLSAWIDLGVELVNMRLFKINRAVRWGRR